MLLSQKLLDMSKQVADIRRNFESARFSPGDNGPGLERGFSPIQTQEARESFKRRVIECAMLIAEVKEGRRPSWHLQEAMSTSDFPYLFGSVLGRQMMGAYETIRTTYETYFKIRNLKDFRSLNLYAMNGGDETLGGPLKEYEPYPETTFTEETGSFSIGKYGRRYGISFEMLINDDQGVFAERPQMMAQGARLSEELLATQQVFDANGPNATFFTVGHGNIVTGNPAFGITGFQTAMTQLSTRKNAAGNPLQFDMVYLVHGPALEVAVNNLLNATELRLSLGGSDIMVTGNWMRNRIKPVVNYLIPQVVTSGTVASTAWVLVAAPSTVSNRAAFNFGFLQGRRRPQLFIKDPDARQLGGGDVSALEGSFDNDSIDYKVRHIFGAGQGDTNMAMASWGQ
jgi:hypothetical protein